MRNKKEITLIISTILIVLLLTIGLSYAYFSANITGNEEETTITVTGGTLRIIYNGGEKITATDIIPSNNPFAIKNFTITGNNNTDLDMNYNLHLVVTQNTFTNNAIHYKLTGTNTDLNGEVVTNIDQTPIKTGPSNILLGSGKFIGNTDGNKVHTYNLEIYFPETGVAQNEDLGKIFGAFVRTKEGIVVLDPDYDYAKEVNKPALVTGMTPVIWDGTEFVSTTPDDSSWYDYDAKRWANARTADGSYWVWIPRYAYKITSGYHDNITGTIDIKFLKGRTNEMVDGIAAETEGYVANVKDTSMHYFLHPSFVFNSEELGFWVAKYESSVANQNDPCYITPSALNCDKDNLTPKYIPNAPSFRYIKITNAFAISEGMKNKTETYGWVPDEVDTHLIKNSEWGAVAYLSKSKYGADTKEIWNNSFNEYRTGCSGTQADSANEAVCVEYDTENGVKASTTHNIYGVYDMSGGSFEYTSSYVDNNHPNLNDFGNNIIKSLAKYRDVYKVGETDSRSSNYEANKNIYGDAVYEISSSGEDITSWYGAYTSMPQESSPFFVRGGNYNNGENAGIFSFYHNTGTTDRIRSWRVIAIAK